MSKNCSKNIKKSYLIEKYPASVKLISKTSKHDTIYKIKM